MHTISSNTTALIVLFAIIYLALILRRTAHTQLDLYDLTTLSAVAILPVVFVFPSFNNFVTQLTGVTFPFVILFGLLLGIAFLFIHRLTLRLHRLENDQRLLIQELSLLQQEINSINTQQEKRLL